MSLSELSIWVRDTEHPCLPYQSSRHSFVAVIVSCGFHPLSFGAVQNGLFWLTEPGKGGGKVHGQVKVPPGCYLVFGVATCKNVYTDFAYVQAGCDQTVCVNLLPKRVSTCAGQLIQTIRLALNLGAANYSFSSPEGQDVPKDVLEKAAGALEELVRHLPKDPVLERQPIKFDELKKMAAREGKQK